MECRQYLRADACYRRTIRHLVFSRGSQRLDARSGTRACEERRSHSGCDAFRIIREEPNDVFRGNITIPQAMIDERRAEFGCRQITDMYRSGTSLSAAASLLKCF